MSTFDLVIDILTIVAGVFGIVSITVVGIQHLMAGRTATKVKKTDLVVTYSFNSSKIRCDDRRSQKGELA